MVFSLALLVSSSVCGDDPVTLTIRGARLENAIPRIAEATALPLRVDNAIKDRVVVVSFRNRSRSSLIRFLAEQVGATWVKRDDGVLVLTETPEDVKLRQVQQAALERQGLEAVKAQWKAEVGTGQFTPRDVERFVNAVVDQGAVPPPGQGKSLDGPRLASPISLLAKSFIAALDDATLLGLAPEQSIYFSDMPNRLQRKPGEKAMAAIDAFWSNTKLFVDLKSALLGANHGAGFDRDLIELEWPGVGTGKSIVRLSRFGSTLSASATAYRADGSMFCNGFTQGESIFPKYTLPRELKSVQETKFRLSSDSAEIESFRAGRVKVYGEFNEETTNGHVLALLCDPEGHDPLSFLATDLFLTWAQKLDLDLVAYLPASFNKYLLGASKEGTADLNVLWSTLERIRTLQVVSRDGVLLARPIAESFRQGDAGYAERLGRLNRGLARFEGRLDATARFLDETYRALGHPGRGQLELIQWTTAGVIPQDWNQDGLYFLPLWHRLPRTLREAINNGGTLYVRDLPLEAREYLNGVLGEWPWSSDRVPYSHLAMHPTEHFVNGIPLDTVVATTLGRDVTVTTTTQMQFVDGMRESLSNYSLSKIAENLADPDRARKFSPALYNLEKSEKVRVSPVRTVKLTFNAPDGTSSTVSVQVPTEKPEFTTLSPEQLVQKYLGGQSPVCQSVLIASTREAVIKTLSRTSLPSGRS